jgi:hypothetical protein
MNPKPTAERLERGATVYIRQSTPGQVLHLPKEPAATGCAGRSRAPVGLPAGRRDRPGSGTLGVGASRAQRIRATGGRGMCRHRGSGLLHRSLAPGTQWSRVAPPDRIVRHDRDGDCGPGWHLRSHLDERSAAAGAEGNHERVRVKPAPHYDDAIVLTSPVAAQLLGTPSWKVVGKANLREYFRRGLEAYPELGFRLEDVLWGVSSVLFYYTNQRGTRTGEFLELSAAGKVTRVVANYSA